MIWFVFSLGLLVGFLVGVVLDDALNLYRASRKEAPMDSGRRRISTGLTFALVVVVLIQAAVGVMLILTRKDASDYFRCSAQYDAQAAQSSSARLQVAEDVDSAMDDLIRAVASEDRQGFKDALSAYLKLRETQQQQRSNLPPAPDEVCGDVKEVRR